MTAITKSFLISLALLCSSVMPVMGDEPYRVVLEPKHHTTLSAEVDTTVQEIVKRMGERFKKGDVLMKLDDVVYRANREKTQAVLEKSKAELKAARKLYDDKAASLLDLREAEAKVAIAEADQALAQKEFLSCTLVAPYLGKVQDIKVQEYEHVQTGLPLMEILDDNILVAKLLLPSRVALALKLGQTLKIYLPEVSDTFPAVITHIAPGIDPSSSLVKIDSEIKNEKGKLRAGMVGTMQIPTTGTAQ